MDGGMDRENGVTSLHFTYRLREDFRAVRAFHCTGIIPAHTQWKEKSI